MRWNIKPKIELGTKRKIVKFAWLPTKIVMIEVDSKMSYIRIWLEKYYQDQEYNRINSEYIKWFNTSIGYIYNGKVVV